MAHNLTLSENRAKALAEYIRRHDDISPELIHVEWHGEDWDGFIRALDDYPQLLRLDRIRELIAQYPDNHDYCEREFRKLQPAKIYQRLLNEVYPPLRRNEYKIEYNVRNFDLQEARRMVDERPDLLSLQEMYKVAGSYEKGSVDYKRVMDAAARYFPDKPAVLNDRALDALGRGDTAEAIARAGKRVAKWHNSPCCSIRWAWPMPAVASCTRPRSCSAGLRSWVRTKHVTTSTMSGRSSTSCNLQNEYFSAEKIIKHHLTSTNSFNSFYYENQKFTCADRYGSDGVHGLQQGRERGRGQ